MKLFLLFLAWGRGSRSDDVLFEEKPQDQDLIGMQGDGLHLRKTLVKIFYHLSFFLIFGKLYFNYLSDAKLRGEM